MTHNLLNRREVLAALVSTAALPLLSSLGSARAWAATSSTDTDALALPVEPHGEWLVADSEILVDPDGQLLNPHTGRVVFETVGVGLREL